MKTIKWLNDRMQDDYDNVVNAIGNEKDKTEALNYFLETKAILQKEIAEIDIYITETIIKRNVKIEKVEG